ncbi:MAG: hypothetical protein IJR02_14370 [Bacteroidaceae bacterium]|nr:hypothetical protein [Bacteroidaceae bacterium]MBQ6751931.1 hypothetical protein [Bacteroidaceae bacterium]
MMEPRITTLIIVGAIVLLLYIVTLGLIFLDLWAGVRKAKQRGEMRTSEAYKRTIEKVSKYFNMLFAMTLVDCVQIALLFFLYREYGYDIPMLPVFSFFGTAYIAFVEVTSIMEPSNVKEKKQQEDFVRLVTKLATENKDFKDKILDVLKNGGVSDE